ncbi:hypothetical protein LCGC14_2305650 [marine sediment metagenome]|uniref:Uncharacterized protein n=1 Tax=marine sediment metagenome TaxID=412755 RepID=A0A0F9EZJ9_9ZZZZ
MGLVIGGAKTSDKVVELRKTDESVKVYIDAEHVATFFDDGGFKFHGIGGYRKYVGRWVP